WSRASGGSRGPRRAPAAPAAPWSPRPAGRTLPRPRTRGAGRRPVPAALFEKGEIHHLAHPDLLPHPAHPVEPVLERLHILHARLAARLQVHWIRRPDGLDRQLQVLGEDARDLGIIEALVV